MRNRESIAIKNVVRTSLVLLAIIGILSAADQPAAAPATSREAQATHPSTRPALNKSSKKVSAKAPVTQSSVAVIPASAVKISESDYRYVDAKGKAWIYHRSPFGVLVNEEAPPAPDMQTLMHAGPAKASTEPPEEATMQKLMGSGQQATASQKTDITTARDLGDSIYFEGPSPFGVRNWTRSKTELTDDERDAWAAFQQAAKSKQQK